jgi:hemerythrin-like metal-binding protein
MSPLVFDLIDTWNGRSSAAAPTTSRTPAGAAMKPSRSTPVAARPTCRRTGAEYASYHFTEEEALMHGAGLDPRYVEHHEQSHAMFLEEVTQLHGAATSDNRAAAKSLLQFLTHWLTYHILGSDQFMARQIEAVKSGTPAQDAVHAEAPGKDPAMDTLLTALNGLFE